MSENLIQKKLGLKQEVILHCRNLLEAKINSYRQKLNELVEDAANDSKSSAGDKHETARAMMQIEQEKLITQLHEAERQSEVIALLKPEEKFNTVRMGALAETSKGLIFFSVPMGKIQVNGLDLMVISPLAPLAKAMLGSKINDSVSFNGTDYLIKKIS